MEFTDKFINVALISLVIIAGSFFITIVSFTTGYNYGESKGIYEGKAMIYEKILKKGDTNETH